MSYIDRSHLPRQELPLRPVNASSTLMTYAAGLILSAMVGLAAVLLHGAGDQARHGIDFMGP